MPSESELQIGLPRTVVGLSSTTLFDSDPRSLVALGADLDPRTAGVLAAVLIAAAEQVSDEKLRTFGVSSPAELTLLALSMAFRDDDTGLMGDVFEWSLLSAVNLGDPQIAQMSVDALQMVGLRVEAPQAILVAAERGRLVQFSPSTPPKARVLNGRRGRPRLVANVLKEASTTSWKADVLLGADEQWIAASLKSNPASLRRSLTQSMETPHPVRIGVTADLSSRAGLTRDPDTGAVIMKVPVDGLLMALTRSVLQDVRTAFNLHLNVPDNPIHRDLSGIGVQLNRWRNHSIAYVVGVLHAVAGDRRLAVGDVERTDTDASSATDALVALDPITAPVPLRRGLSQLEMHQRRVASLTRFKPID